MPKVFAKQATSLMNAEPVKEAQEVGKKQALKAMSFKDALSALSPTTDKVFQKMEGLQTFSGVTDMLKGARSAATAVGSSRGASARATGDLGGLLNMLKMKVDEIAGSTEYVQKGDLGTRKGMDQAEKQRHADKAAEDLKELQQIISAIAALAAYVADAPMAHEMINNTLEHLGMTLSEIGFSQRTFRSEAFRVNVAKDEDDPTRAPADSPL